MMNQSESLAIQILFGQPWMPRVSFEVVNWNLVVRDPDTCLNLNDFLIELPALMNKRKQVPLQLIVELLLTSFYYIIN
jgi:hypothetical protein